MRSLRSASSTRKSFNDLTGLDALGADVLFKFLPIDQNIDRLQVRVPQPFGLAIRVRNAVPDDWFFATDKTFACHDVNIIEYLDKNVK